jgi:hypothetical protein
VRGHEPLAMMHCNVHLLVRAAQKGISSGENSPSREIAMGTDNNGYAAVIIHSQNGQLGSSPLSSAVDLGRALEDGLGANPDRGLVIHFHGGLVSVDAGKAIAMRLDPIYRAAGTFPMFFVWESGLIETLKNNLSDILADPVFRELAKKAGEWVLRNLPGAFSARGTGQTVNEYALRKQFDDWFDGKVSQPPLTLGSPATGGSKAAVPNEDDLTANIEASLDNDQRFQQVVSGLSRNSGGGGITTKGANVPPDPTVPVYVDQRALDEMFGPRTPGKTKGVLTWITVARFVARVVIAVLKRHNAHRDHGTYTTIVEEVLRAAYLDKVGQIVWDMMKKDTADAFASADNVGSVLLAGLAQRQRNGRQFKSIALVGHSTGAVYICNFIQSALQVLPGIPFNVIFLAPACRFELFDETVQKASGSFAGFRMFAMHDALEMGDQLVPIVYPRSLLYLVSGLLEGDADTPILGMERFLTLSGVFTGKDFVAVDRVRAWLSQNATRNVWSDDIRPNGFGSIAHKHGDFDDDQSTLVSVQYILKSGY